MPLIGAEQVVKIEKGHRREGHPQEPGLLPEFQAGGETQASDGGQEKDKGENQEHPEKLQVVGKNARQERKDGCQADPFPRRILPVPPGIKDSHQEQGACDRVKNPSPNGPVIVAVHFSPKEPRYIGSGDEELVKAQKGLIRPFEPPEVASVMFPEGGKNKGQDDYQEGGSEEDGRKKPPLEAAVSPKERQG